MKIFRNYTYSWWQIGLLKLALLSIGIAIGARWYEVFLPYFIALVVFGLVFGFCLLFVSLGQR